MPTHAIDVRAVPLPTAEPVPDDQVVSGAPLTAALIIDDHRLPGVEVGIWEHTVGASTDVEADEVFVVISGRATVVLEGGETLELHPGSLGVLEAGARTTWNVHEPLRKVYLTHH